MHPFAGESFQDGIAFSNLYSKGGSHMKRVIIIAVLFCLLVASAHSQEREQWFKAPSITANGEALITTEPDQAQIDIGVVTQARGAPEASKENAATTSRVTAEIKKLLGKGDEVKTASYTLNPNYRYPQGGKPELVGYTATNVVRIRTDNLADVGRLIDAGMQSGANTVNRLLFTLKDEHGAQLQALRAASQKAKTKVEEMAAALGLKVVQILSVTEGERGVRPIVIAQARAAQMEMAAAPTPIESGTIEIRSSVTLTAEVGPR
jgi:uncharacterized protein